jgi:acyl carrier protein
MSAPAKETLARLQTIFDRTFPAAGRVRIGSETTAADVEGWDSLSHALLIMGVEGEFGITLPTDRIYELDDVGELVTLIGQVRSSDPTRDEGR